MPAQLPCYSRSMDMLMFLSLVVSLASVEFSSLTGEGGFLTMEGVSLTGEGGSLGVLLLLSLATLLSCSGLLLWSTYWAGYTTNEVNSTRQKI